MQSAIPSGFCFPAHSFAPKVRAIRYDCQAFADAHYGYLRTDLKGWLILSGLHGWSP
jgi:hypothetical protein